MFNLYYSKGPLPSISSCGVFLPHPCLKLSAEDYHFFFETICSPSVSMNSDLIVFFFFLNSDLSSVLSSSGAPVVIEFYHFSED